LHRGYIEAVLGCVRIIYPLRPISDGVEARVRSSLIHVLLHAVMEQSKRQHAMDANGYV